MTANTKASFDRRVRFKPTPENRQEAVDRIIWGLGDITIDENEKDYIDDLTKIVNAANFEAADFYMMMLAFWLGVNASSQILKNNVSVWDAVGLGLNYAFFGQHTAHNFKKYGDSTNNYQMGWFKESTYADPMGGGDNSLFYWCLAVATCPEKIVRPWAHFFYNMLSQKGIYDDVGDYDVAELFWIILQCYCEKRWITPSDLTAELGEDILPMLQAINTPHWEAALMNYCDFRLSRAYEYENIRAIKATSQSWFFGRQWHAIFPLELIALKTIYEQQTGCVLNLNIGHPLLQTPLMNPPKFDSLPEDGLLKKLNAKSAQYYGSTWQPYALLELVPR